VRSVALEHTDIDASDLQLDHSELVWLGTQKCRPAWVFSVSVGLRAAC